VYWQVKSFADVAFAGSTPLSTSPIYTFKISSVSTQALSELLQLLKDKYGVQGIDDLTFVSWTGVSGGILYDNSNNITALINELRRRIPRR
jgi:hypothetical protein